MNNIKEKKAEGFFFFYVLKVNIYWIYTLYRVNKVKRIVGYYNILKWMLSFKNFKLFEEYAILVNKHEVNIT